MLYDNKIETLKEKMRNMNPDNKVKKMTSSLSRGGTIERSVNQRNGKKFNKNMKGNKVLEKIQDTVNKINKNTTSEGDE